MTNRSATIKSLIKRYKKTGLSVAEIQEKTGWDTESDRASISSILSAMRNKDEVEELGRLYRGSNRRLATVYIAN